MSFLESIFICGPKAFWGRFGRAPDARALCAWGAIALAKLKNLAPYALMEILLPGGSVLALTLWFYRRHKRVSAVASHIKSGVVSV